MFSRSIQKKLYFWVLTFVFFTACSEPKGQYQAPSASTQVNEVESPDSESQHSEYAEKSQSAKPQSENHLPSESDPFYLSKSTATRGQLRGIRDNTDNGIDQGGTRKRLSVYLSTCPNTSKGHEFEIRLSESESILRKSSQPDGCIFWEDHVEFEIYSPEKWIEKTYFIQDVENPKQIEKLTFYLNPWQTGTWFSWDINNGKPPQTPADLATPTFAIQDVVYLFTGQDYSLDSDMDLVFKKMYQLRFEPFVKRIDISTEAPIYEPIRDGHYRLRVMVLGTTHGAFSPSIRELSSVEDFISKYKYISGAETIVEARNGVVTSHIELPISFQDIPWLASRNQLLIELSSVDGEVGPLPTVAILPFNGVAERSMSGALTLKANMAEVAQKVIAMLPSDELSIAHLLDVGRTGKNFQNHPSQSLLGVRHLSSERIHNVGISDRELDALVLGGHFSDPNFIATYARALSKVCSDLSDILPASRVNACKAAPRAFFKVSKVKKIRQIKGSPILNQSRVSLISFNAAMSFDQNENQSNAQGKTKGKSLNYGVSSRAGLNLWVFSSGVDVAASKNTDWFSSNTVTYSQVHSRISSVNSGKMLMVEEMEFDFQAESLNCVYLTPAIEVKQPWAEQLCSSKDHAPQKLRESWFYIYQAFLNNVSPMRDMYSLAQSPWIKLIRGQKEFDRFKDVVENHQTYLFLSPSRINGTAAGNVENLAEKFTRTHPLFSDGAIPGMLFSE